MSDASTPAGPVNMVLPDAPMLPMSREVPSALAPTAARLGAGVTFVFAARAAGCSAGCAAGCAAGCGFIDFIISDNAAVTGLRIVPMVMLPAKWTYQVSNRWGLRPLGRSAWSIRRRPAALPLTQLLCSIRPGSCALLRLLPRRMLWPAFLLKQWLLPAPFFALPTIDFDTLLAALALARPYLFASHPGKSYKPCLPLRRLRRLLLLLTCHSPVMMIEFLADAWRDINRSASSVNSPSASSTVCASVENTMVNHVSSSA